MIWFILIISCVHVIPNCVNLVNFLCLINPSYIQIFEWPWHRGHSKINSKFSNRLCHVKCMQCIGGRAHSHLPPVALTPTERFIPMIAWSSRAGAASSNQLSSAPVAVSAKYLGRRRSLRTTTTSTPEMIGVLSIRMKVLRRRDVRRRSHFLCPNYAWCSVDILIWFKPQASHFLRRQKEFHIIKLERKQIEKGWMLSMAEQHEKGMWNFFNICFVFCSIFNDICVNPETIPSKQLIFELWGF